MKFGILKDRYSIASLVVVFVTAIYLITSFAYNPFYHDQVQRDFILKGQTEVTIIPENLTISRLWCITAYFNLTSCMGSFAIHYKDENAAIHQFNIADRINTTDRSFNFSIQTSLLKVVAIASSDPGYGQEFCSWYRLNITDFNCFTWQYLSILGSQPQYILEPSFYYRYNGILYLRIKDSKNSTLDLYIYNSYGITSKRNICDSMGEFTIAVENFSYLKLFQSGTSNVSYIDGYYELRINCRMR